MKKYLMTIAAVLCCAMTTTVFTACGDDDDTSSPSQPKIVAYQVDYSLEFPQEINGMGNLYLLYDKIEVGYVDENGQAQREVVSNGKWSKSVTYKKTVDCDFTLYLTKPANLNTDNLPYEKYINEVKAFPNQLSGITAIYSDGKKVANTAGTNIIGHASVTYTITKAKLQDFFEKLAREEVYITSFTLPL